MDDSNKARINVTTDMQAFGLMVTAEPYYSVTMPSDVVVLENIYRHLELGEQPAVAAEKGGMEVALPVLASTLTTIVVFFPVGILGWARERWPGRFGHRVEEIPPARRP